jgi:hypothetical protein
MANHISRGADIRRHESALMTAAHILERLTKECKSHEEIAEDFDNNLELVSVWIDYMIGINWVYKDSSEKWMATAEGKKWIEKYNSI